MGRRNKKKKFIPFRKQRFVPLSSQMNAIKSKCPNWEVEIKNGVLIAVGNVQPTGLSPSYTVKLTYNRTFVRPYVTIISPPLEKIDDENPPHLFPKKRLCLFYWKYKEWTKGEIIATTVIQWISLWLYYYEIWLVNGGTWLGGGTKHQKNNKTIVEDFPMENPQPTPTSISPNVKSFPPSD